MGNLDREQSLRIVDISSLDGLLQTYQKKSTVSNSFMLLDEIRAHCENGLLNYSIDGDNLYFFLRKEAGFYRLYYYINNFARLPEVNLSLPIVQELIYRGKQRFPITEVEFWQKAGFVRYLGRDNYFLKSDDLSNLQLEESSSQDEVKRIDSSEEIRQAEKLINQNLDLYTGDILSLNELEKFAKEGNLFGIFAEGRAVAILQSEFQNKVYWLGHMVVDADHRGKGLSSQLLRAYFLEGLQRQAKSFQLWVIDDNEAALGLYQNNGFRYLNKSTISLLKK